MSLIPTNVASANENYYFALDAVVNVPQVLSQSGNTVTLSNGGGSVNIASTTSVATSAQKLTAQTYSTGLNSTNFAGQVIATGLIRSAPPLGAGSATLNGGSAEVTIAAATADPTLRYQKDLSPDATIAYDGTTLNVDTHLKIAGLMDTNGTTGTQAAILSAGSGAGEVRWMNNAMGSFECVVTQTQGQVQFQRQSFTPLGISQSSLTEFTVAQAGMYMLTASLMFETPTGGNNSVYFWLRSDVKGPLHFTNTRVTIPNNDTRLATVQWIIPIDGNDNERIAIEFASSDAAMTVVAELTPPFGPEIPAVILTISQLSEQVLP